MIEPYYRRSSGASRVLVLMMVITAATTTSVTIARNLARPTYVYICAMPTVSPATVTPEGYSNTISFGWANCPTAK